MQAPACSLARRELGRTFTAPPLSAMTCSVPQSKNRGAFVIEGYPKDDEAQAAETIINEFHRVDPDGQTLRYDRKKGTLEVRPYKELPSHIGVADLRTRMDSVYHYLDSCYAGILGCWDARQQAID